jgi:4-carboxymuconolactone decarboxylase
MSRMPAARREELSAESQAVYDRIAATRGGLRGPYGVLLHHAALADRVAALGEQLRFRSGLCVG